MEKLSPRKDAPTSKGLTHVRSSYGRKFQQTLELSRNQKKNYLGALGHSHVGGSNKCRKFQHSEMLELLTNLKNDLVRIQHFVF